jgi:DNA-binding phage protein
MDNMSKVSKMLRAIVKKEKIPMARLAKEIEADRASLYYTLSDAGNPESRTMEKILWVLGYEIRFVKLKKKRGRK